MDHAPAFTDEELRGCAEGKCCQCARCCTVYEVSFVPIRPGQAGLALKKPAGLRCWQLVEEVNGRFRCLLQAQGKPFVCERWNGAERRDPHRAETNYENLRDTDARWIAAPYDERNAAVIQDDLRRGAYPSDLRALAQHYCRTQPLRTVRKYVVEYRTLPHEIFAFLDLRGALATLDMPRHRLVRLLGLQERDALHQAFLEEYLPAPASATLSPYDDPEHVLSTLPTPV